jgi:UDP-3-O-[3-hydroxymyristoyl] glucosamine N-acyltransferase
MGVLVGDSPRDLFFEIHEHLVNQMPAPQAAAQAPEVDIHPTAVIHPAARIGRGARIAEFVVVRARVTIGADVTIEPGAKVGVDGILHRMVNGRQRLIPHAGRVLIGDGAMLMSNSTVVSAIFPDDSTVVGEGSLLGMNAVVGHEAFVGCNCVVSNDVVLARRAKVSDRAFIGTSAVIREYVSIGADARVMAGSVVIADVAAGGAVSGNFATDHGSRLREFARSHVQVTDHRRTSDDHS